MIKYCEENSVKRGGVPSYCPNGRLPDKHVTGKWQYSIHGLITCFLPIRSFSRNVNIRIKEYASRQATLSCESKYLLSFVSL